jgi:hypothetical protein
VQVCQALQREHVDVRVLVEDRPEAERLSEVLRASSCCTPIRRT